MPGGCFFCRSEGEHLPYCLINLIRLRVPRSDRVRISGHWNLGFNCGMLSLDPIKISQEKLAEEAIPFIAVVVDGWFTGAKEAPEKERIISDALMKWLADNKWLHLEEGEENERSNRIRAYLSNGLPVWIGPG